MPAFDQGEAISQFLSIEKHDLLLVDSSSFLSLIKVNNEPLSLNRLDLSLVFCTFEEIYVS